MQNKVFTDTQSVIIPGDTCVAQLLSVTHEIYENFDYISSFKSLCKVWYEGLVLKLKFYGIDGDLLKLLTKDPEDCKQWVVLNTLCWVIHYSYFT